MTDFELAHAYDTVNLHRRGAAAKIELNRPERMNAWDKQFGVDLLAAVQAVAADDDVRAVMITGAGRGLLLGRRPQGGLRPDARRPARRLHRRSPSATTRSSSASARCPSRCVAAVNGAAVGIGCSLAICSDLIVAAESAYFLLAFVNIGLDPGRRLVGVRARARGLHARAAEMAMLGERVPAPAGARVGADQPRRIPTTPSQREVERAARPPGRRARRAPTPGTKRQLNRWIYARDGGAARARGAGSSRSRRPRTTSSRASWRSSRSARRASPAPDGLERSSLARRGARRSIRMLPAVPQCPSLLRRALLLSRRSSPWGSWSPGPPLADAFTPSPAARPNADDIDTLCKIVLVVALIVLVGVEGLLLYTVIRFRKRKGTRGRPDPRQHAAGDRLDGRRGA